jgi:hypothetical protein
MEGRQASVTVEQADRNTARLHSGTYLPRQYIAYNRQLAAVELSGGMAYFDSYMPDKLEFSPICTDCGTSFPSCKSDAERCYNCWIVRLCPPLPGVHFRHWWGSTEVWSLQVHGDVGFSNETNYWWYNHNSSGNTGHQGLIAYRDSEGTIKKLVFTTAAQNAYQRYRITWDLEANTATFSTSPWPYVNDSEYAPKEEVLDELDPFVLDFIIGMIPAEMLHIHRPRNSSNGCYA